MSSSISSSKIPSISPVRLGLDSPVFKVTPEIESFTFEDIQEQCKTLKRAHITKEKRYVVQALRVLPLVRRRLTANVVSRLVNYYFVGPDVARRRRELLSYVQMTPKASTSCASESSTTPTAAKDRRTEKRKPKRAQTSYSILPEIETYLHLLVVIYLFQENRLGHVRAIKCCGSLIKRLEAQNLRLLDPLAAKVYYFYCLMHERIGKLSSCCKYLDKRLLVAKLRRHDDSHATLINCLLRLYTVEKSFDLASSLIEDDKRCGFPTEADVYQWARFHYYTGVIRAVQRRYDEARQALILALKKAPLLIAEGFRYSIVVLLICVELLLGHLPDRTIYREYSSSKVLEPYLKLAQAVRDGDVKLFDKTLKDGWKTFDEDQTLNFVVHLKDSVIKAALRQLSTAYSKIYIRQLCKKLLFDHSNDAIAILSKVRDLKIFCTKRSLPGNLAHLANHTHILIICFFIKCYVDNESCAQAIKDKTIQAVLDYENGWLEFKSKSDMYTSPAPQNDLNERTQLLLQLQRQAAKAMRFAPKVEPKPVETPEQKRQREQNELEFARDFGSEEEDFS